MKAPFPIPVAPSHVVVDNNQLLDDDSNFVAEVKRPYIEFVTTAINSHEALVEALEKLNTYAYDDGRFCWCKDAPKSVDADHDTRCERARAALAKAKKRS